MEPLKTADFHIVHLGKLFPLWSHPGMQGLDAASAAKPVSGETLADEQHGNG